MPLAVLQAEVAKLCKAVSAWQSGNEAAVRKAGLAGFGGHLLPVLSSFHEPLSLKLRPQSLLDALWVQLLLAVVHKKAFRDCAICKKPYEIGPPANRVTRAYCSDACRNKAQRERISKAKEMREKGMSVADIAAAFNTSVKVAKGWLKE
jgi:hypothetical protein